MSASSSIALVFGAGQNVGAGVVKAFSAKGYRIATVSRTATEDTSDKRLHIQADLEDPESVSAVFATVRKQLGHPSVVVYNGAAATFVNKEDPLELPIKDAIRDMNINTFSALAAAKEAVKSFEALPNDEARTFIFTGNITNSQPIPALMSQGMGKSATAHMIQTAASVYADRGYSFYYADERKADGAAVYRAIDGEAHGKFYVELSEKDQGPWLATFVKGTGYIDFS
ncbi:hypothetical protein LTR72_003054 [Exophiala xenobiotica]|nr:hypothetical protein LTR72_003054 [Exophiala xenobiotica]KAK5300813.1 hypothetical protein LTR14_001211 [Exophiala xenobiotica]KAK5489755.1 hypothetical protein LTR55_004274 [Exophiala xenobiotica]